MADIIDTMKNGTEWSEKKNHGKPYGDFKGELKPVKESWCPKCLVQQKAKVIDQVTAGNIGSVLKKVVNPGEPQIHPIKIHTKMPKSPKEKEERKERVDIYEDRYKVPEWATKWEKKTRNDMRREIREGKMQMVDRIRVLRDIVQANGMSTNELEQRIQAQTEERRAAEQKKKADIQMEKREKNAEIEAAINAKIVKKAKEKADKIRDHLAREAKRKARVR